MHGNAVAMTRTYQCFRDENLFLNTSAQSKRVTSQPFRFNIDIDLLFFVVSISTQRWFGKRHLNTFSAAWGEHHLLSQGVTSMWPHRTERVNDIRHRIGLLVLTSLFFLHFSKGRAHRCMPNVSPSSSTHCQLLLAAVPALLVELPCRPQSIKQEKAKHINR